MFKIDVVDYMIFLIGDDVLREFVLFGKSGSVFYFLYDDWFIIKMMKKVEVKVIYFVFLGKINIIGGIWLLGESIFLIYVCYCNEVCYYKFFWYCEISIIYEIIV